MLHFSTTFSKVQPFAGRSFRRWSKEKNVDWVVTRKLIINFSLICRILHELFYIAEYCTLTGSRNCKNHMQVLFHGCIVFVNLARNRGRTDLFNLKVLTDVDQQHGSLENYSVHDHESNILSSALSRSGIKLCFSLSSLFHNVVQKDHAKE